MARAQTIVVKRIKKGHAAHHGGAWKVAYADFVTAMMAFFLLLWLLNAVSQEQLEGISDYFAPITTAKSTSGGTGMMQGRTIDSRGVYNATERRAKLLDQFAQQEDGEDEQPSEQTEGESRPTDPSDAQLEELLREREEKQFQQAGKQLKQAIEGNPELKPLANSLLIDDTPEGLRIQIIDQEGLPMFPRGSDEMFAHTRKILEQVARVVQTMPQAIAITGHTDATRYASDGIYGNWELSVDRANAARRTLAQFGVADPRISYVVGKAATEPLSPKDPEAPGNRRLTFLLLRGSAPQP